jgi:ABC-type transport system involved in multi-copper enzyme maturation permease subunit
LSRPRKKPTNNHYDPLFYISIFFVLLLLGNDNKTGELTMKKIIGLALGLSIGAFGLVGCTGAEVGSTTGAAAGAGLGYAVSGGTALGTVIGAGAGALVGNSIGQQQDYNNYYRHRPYYHGGYRGYPRAYRW